jgi:glycolate oxidase
MDAKMLHFGQINRFLLRLRRRATILAKSEENSTKAGIPMPEDAPNAEPSNSATLSNSNPVPGYDVEPVPPGQTKAGVDLAGHKGLIDQLSQVLGAENVKTDDESRAFFAEDTFRSFETPLAAISPISTEDLSRAASACHDARVALVPRGGGMSYTDGYLHTRVDSITVDTQKMDRILEINEEDMYVTVECGCTWAELNDALKEKDLRTPYWGPLSGFQSRVGGALSQNSVFFGSGFYGSAVEQVIGMDVVLADGTILPVGSHALEGGLPFMKHYGPDLMGPFLADSGALGIKATATLRVIRRPEHRRHFAYAFDTYADLATALSSLGREGLATEAMGFDKNLQSARVSEGSGNILGDVGTMFKVIRESGLADGLQIAIAGRRYLNDVFYGLHASVEDHTKGGVEDKLREAKTVAKKCGGRPLPASITKIVHAEPFLPPDSILGPQGERWIPIHCIVPHSKAVVALDAVTAVFEKYAEAKEKHGIRNGFLLVGVANYGFIIEPVWFWPDARLKMYEKVMRREHLEKLPIHEADEEGRATVKAMRDELTQIFADMGMVSMQLGKLYRYDQSRKPEAWGMLKKIKAVVDPNGLMNPGALKL